jgi:hypothetical protein
MKSNIYCGVKMYGKGIIAPITFLYVVYPRKTQ